MKVRIIIAMLSISIPRNPENNTESNILFEKLDWPLKNMFFFSISLFWLLDLLFIISSILNLPIDLVSASYF